MFAALARYFRIFIYKITGRVDAAAQLAAANHHVMNAQYAEVIRAKTERINGFMEAVAILIHQNQKKADTLKALSAEVVDMRRHITGATNKAKIRAKELMGQGLTEEQAKLDEVVQSCLVFVRDHKSTLAEKEARIKALEEEVKENDKSIAERKNQALQLKREIEAIKTEQGEAVADVIMSQETERANKILAQISEDDTSKTLEGLREMRGKAKAKAKVSEFVAETDAKRQAAEFDAFAQNTEADADFFSDVFETPKTEAATAAPAAKENEDPLA